MTDSTESARGPERIWAWARADNWDTNGHCTSKQEWAEDSDTAYIRADLAPDPLVDARVFGDAIIAAIEAMPTREEILGGQRFKYIQLGEAVDTIRAALAAIQKEKTSP